MSRTDLDRRVLRLLAGYAAFVWLVLVPMAGILAARVAYA